MVPLIVKREHVFWYAHTLGWCAFALVHYLGSLLHDLRDIFIVIILINTYAAWLFSIPMRYIYRKSTQLSLIKIAVIVLISSYFFGALWQIVKNINYWEIYHYGYKPESIVYYLKHSVYSFYIMLSWSVLYFGSNYYQMLQRERQNLLKAKAMAHESQVKMLRYQLNPHFLFNTLNAISTLILVKENDTANGMVTKLSDFLRYSLANDPVKKTTLAAEIDALKLYLAIEKVRFAEKLTVTFNIEQQCQHALIPSLLLQPLVENAIKYAVSVTDKGGAISINAKQLDDKLLISVEDNGPGVNSHKAPVNSGSGVGLANIQERLKAQYANNHQFTITNKEPNGVKVMIKIPFQTESDNLKGVTNE